MKIFIDKDCNCNCKRKCNKFLSADEGKALFNFFFMLISHTNKTNCCVKAKSIMKCEPIHDPKPSKSQSLSYFLRVNNISVQFCKKYFITQNFPGILWPSS